MSATTRIFVEFSFDAAHRLPNVPTTHKCGRLHGHTYRLTLWFAGAIDPTLGWVIDYAMVKAGADEILAQLDHRFLNDVDGLDNPTCELIAEWIARRLNLLSFGTAKLVEIELRETERAGVRLRCE